MPRMKICRIVLYHFAIIIIIILSRNVGFSGNSAGKESACKAGDPSLIPWSGRSPGGGIDYALQCSWASLVAQLVRILLQCRRPGFDPWVGKFPWISEHPLEKGTAPHSSILAWRIPQTVQSMVTKSWTRLSHFHFHSIIT